MMQALNHFISYLVTEVLRSDASNKAQVRDYMEVLQKEIVRPLLNNTTKAQTEAGRKKNRADSARLKQLPSLEETKAAIQQAQRM